MSKKQHQPSANDPREPKSTSTHNWLHNCCHHHIGAATLVIAMCLSLPSCLRSADKEQELRMAVERIYEGRLQHGNAILIADPYSAELERLIDKDDEYARNTAEIGVIDYDIWIMAQDSDNPKMEVRKVVVQDDNTVDVDVTITDMGIPPHSQTLRLVKENDEWRVDDFIDEYGSLKAKLKEFHGMSPL